MIPFLLLVGALTAFWLKYHDYDLRRIKMTTFGTQNMEDVLAEEILDTINQFDWNPSVQAMDAIIALVNVLEYITRQYSAYEEMEQ